MPTTKPRESYCTTCAAHIIMEIVDSISRDGLDVTYTEHITKTKTSRKWYTFKTSNLHSLCVL